MSLQCCACELVKSLDQFTKSQKRKGETPRCIECIDERRLVVLVAPEKGDYRRCSKCKMIQTTTDFETAQTFKCKSCSTKKKFVQQDRNNAAARLATSGACRVRDVQEKYGHLCEIPLNAYIEAGVADSWNDYVTEWDVDAASSSWDARSIAHEIDTQWGEMPHGGAYSDSNHYFGPGEYDYY
jgi:hypothetical protein